MFQRKKYVMKFKKTYQCIQWGMWYEVTDAYLLYVLLELMKKYDFDIISVKFKNSFDVSRIKIKCNKKDKAAIFTEYYALLCTQIEEVSL